MRHRGQPGRARLIWFPLSLGIAFLLAVGLFGSHSLAVAAAEVRSGDNPSVPAGETVNDDLYLFGGDVTIAGTVNGDAVVASGTLKVPGRVNGNLNVAAGELDIAGSVQRSVRVAAGTVTITGDIAGDLVITGGTVTIETTGAVGGDVLVAGGDVKIRGPVDGDVRGKVSNLQISEEIGGDVRVTVSTLDLQTGARIDGDLKYTSADPADIATGVTVTGTRTHTESSQFTPGNDIRSFLFSPIFRLLVALFTGLVLILLLPRAAAIVADGIRKAPASTFVVGLIMLFVVPVVAVILLFTVIGIPVSIMLWVSYAILLYLSQIFLGLALGRLILPKSWDMNGRGYNLLAMTLGVVFLAALRIIPVPYLSTVIAALTAIFGLGAIVIGPRYWRTRATVAPAY